MNTKPQSRKEDIVIQELEKELLIYDLQINNAFSLNETCAMVWAECDGEKSIAEISSILSRRTKGLVNEEVVWLALETLQKENLLTNSDGISSKFNGMSRREVIRKVGFASMVAIPVITSLIAPSASNAASGPSGVCANFLQTCVFVNNTQSNCCNGLRCFAQSQCFNCSIPNELFAASGNTASLCQSDCVARWQNRCCSSSIRSDLVGPGACFCYCN